MIFGVRVKIPKNKPATPVSDCIFTLTPKIGDRLKSVPEGRVIGKEKNAD